MGGFTGYSLTCINGCPKNRIPGNHPVVVRLIDIALDPINYQSNVVGLFIS